MKIIREKQKHKLKMTTVFLDDHIIKYLIFKRISKNLSKVSMIMMDKYIKYKGVASKMNNCLWIMSRKGKWSRKNDMPKPSSVKHKKINIYLWLPDKFTKFTLINNDRAIICKIITSTLQTKVTTNQSSNILWMFFHSLFLVFVYYSHTFPPLFRFLK